MAHPAHAAAPPWLAYTFNLSYQPDIRVNVAYKLMRSARAYKMIFALLDRRLIQL